MYGDHEMEVRDAEAITYRRARHVVKEITALQAHNLKPSVSVGSEL